jgi:sugar phosphate isomerase/epimerase
VARLFADAGVPLAMLSTDCSFESPDRRRLDEQVAVLLKTLDLAAELSCPLVSISSGSVPARQPRDKVLVRIAGKLRELAPLAAERRVGILLRNEGSLAGSRDVWYLVDAAGHAAIASCWNPAHAQAVGDPSGLAVPRIGRMIRASHLVDAVFAVNGSLSEYAALGQGKVELDRFLTLMKGIGSRSNLIIDWPGSGNMPDAAAMLPAAIEWIKQALARIEQVPDLSAYKGDKNAPKYAPAAS